MPSKESHFGLLSADCSLVFKKKFYTHNNNQQKDNKWDIPIKIEMRVLSSIAIVFGYLVVVYLFATKSVFVDVLLLHA